MSSARAQDASPPEGYRTLIVQALEEFDGRRWAEARALFRRAHAIEPNARTLRGMGMASFELREYAAAIEAFDASLASSRRPLTPTQRDHVEGLRARAEAFVARYDLRIAVADAQVDVDGVRVPRSDTLVLDLGRHTLRVSAPGHTPWTRAIEVAGGERESIEVQLASEAPAPASDPPVAVPESAPRVLASPPEREPDLAGLSLLLTGGGTLLLTGLPVAWWVDRETALSACSARPCTNAGLIAEQRDVAAGLSLSALGVGAVLGVTGAVLLLSADDETRRACGPAGAGLRCRF